MASGEILPPLSEEDKMLSGLAYPCWFVVPAFVLLSHKKEDPFLCFHAIQGLFFGALASLATLVVVLGVWILFHVLPQAGGTFSGLLGVGVFGSIFIFVSLLFLASIFIGWQASSGRFLKLPLAGEWAELKMVEMLELDYEAAQQASAPRSVKEKSAAEALEPIPFPTSAPRSGEAEASRINPEMAAQYARQLLQTQKNPPQKAPPPSPPRSAPPPPAQRPAPTPPRGSGTLPSAFQKPARPPQPPARPSDSSSDDSLSARRWLGRGDSSS